MHSFDLLTHNGYNDDATLQNVILQQKPMVQFNSLAI